MKIIDREMKVIEQVSNKSNHSLYCQASFNSDGVITLRNYNVESKDSDEIMVFSAEETRAIIELFKQMKRIGALPSDMPF